MSGAGESDGERADESAGELQLEGLTGGGVFTSVSSPAAPTPLSCCRRRLLLDSLRSRLVAAGSIGVKASAIEEWRQQNG